MSSKVLEDKTEFEECIYCEQYALHDIIVIDLHGDGSNVRKEMRCLNCGATRAN